MVRKPQGMVHPSGASEKFLKEVHLQRRTDWDSWVLQAYVLNLGASALEARAGRGRKASQLFYRFLRLVKRSSSGVTTYRVGRFWRIAKRNERLYEVSQMLRGMSLECALKAAIIRDGHELPKHHRLSDLYSLLGLAELSPEELALLRTLERMNQLGRFPFDSSPGGGDIKHFELGFDVDLFKGLFSRVCPRREGWPIFNDAECR